MEGGHLLGQGSYGCAFTPPLLCKSRPKSYGKVGKITIKEDATHEIAIANRLRKMPLHRHFFLLADPESCEPLPIPLQKDKEIKDCDATTRDDEYKVQWSQTRQLFLPFGGKNPLGNMIMESNLHPKFFPFFDFMRHVLEAGSTLLLAGVCHYDLHPNNFIQDPYGVVRILDFGQSFTVNSIDDETMRWKQLFFGFEKDGPHPMIPNAEPPEITVLNAKRNGYSLESAIANTLKGKQIFQDMQRILGMTLGGLRDEMDDFFATSMSVTKNDWIEFYKLYWTGFDAWAIGSLCLTVLKYQMSWVEFVNGDWKQRKGMTLLALRGLLHPNPRKRLDCIEALFLFDPANSWIQKFGKPWIEKRKLLRKRLEKN